MNTFLPYAIIFCLLCAVSCPARPAEQSARLVVTEGSSIGYPTVADALATLESRGLAPAPGLNDDVSFVEPDNGTAWNFVGKDNPAYPSAVRYVYSRTSGVLHAEVTILCEASAARCENFRSDIRDHLAQLAKRMAGDPSAKCSVNDNVMQCGEESARQQSSQQVYVKVGDDGRCTVDDVATACPDLGRKIRAEHPSGEPKVSICSSAQADPDLVGNVLNVITAEHLSPVFRCAPH